MNLPLIIAAQWRDRLAVAQLTDAAAWWNDQRINVWRDLPERQNAVIDLDDGVRLHVKRFKSSQDDPVGTELEGIRLLHEANIPTLEVVAHHCGPRPVLVTKDLTGLTSADVLLREGVCFDDLLAPTADLAARLHVAGLHHRDLYLCHFLLKPDGSDCHLIDAARVRPLPWLTKRRWVVKDIAQFIYSAKQANVPEDRIEAWFTRWARAYSVFPGGWRDAVESKVRSIGVHDARESVRARDVSLGKELGVRS